MDPNINPNQFNPYFTPRFQQFPNNAPLNYAAPFLVQGDKYHLQRYLKPKKAVNGLNASSEKCIRGRLRLEQHSSLDPTTGRVLFDLHCSQPCHLCGTDHRGPCPYSYISIAQWKQRKGVALRSNGIIPNKFSYIAFRPAPSSLDRVESQGFVIMSEDRRYFRFTPLALEFGRHWRRVIPFPGSEQDGNEYDDDWIECGTVADSNLGGPNARTPAPAPVPAFHAGPPPAPAFHAGLPPATRANVGRVNRDRHAYKRRMVLVATRRIAGLVIMADCLPPYPAYSCSLEPGILQMRETVRSALAGLIMLSQTL